MKKLVSVLSALVLVVSLYGQTAAKVYTRRFAVADFMEKTTKFVLTGSFYYDQIFRDAVNSKWEISSYEFCTYEEYTRIKNNSDYYFVTSNIMRYSGEQGAGVRVLDVTRGGGDDNPFNIVTMPVGDAAELTDINIFFFPILLDIMQEYIRQAAQYDKFAYGSLSTLASSNRLPKKWTVYKDPESIVEAMKNAEDDAAVEYEIYPSNPTPGVSHSYKMIIGCSDHTLYYYKDSKIRK